MDYPTVTHAFPVAGNLFIQTLVARQWPTMANNAMPLSWQNLDLELVYTPGTCITP